MIKTDLSKYDNSWYNTGGNVLKRLLWYFCNILFIKNEWNPSSVIKVYVLRVFGAKTLSNDWDDVTELSDPDANGYRFFKVTVEMP